jgi:acetylornithine deacetylase/succinyl-diaminopimelate desuccinylase family protein
MTTVRSQILADVVAADTRLIGLCRDLIATPSENPPGDTRALAARLVEILTPVADDVRLVAGHPEMPNVVAVARGRDSGRRLVFNGHLDTFPVGNRRLWSVDPLGGVVKDGKLYGRGVSDMKGGMAASILAFECLRRRRDAWRGELVLTLASDEETMGSWGTAHLLKTVPEATGDAMICGDCGSPDIVRFGEKGLLWLKVTARGRAAHGAHVHLGDNAVDRLTASLAHLVRLRDHRVDTPLAIARAIDAARAVSEPLGGAGESNVLTSITVNVGVITGGSKINLVPDVASAEVDVRLPVGISTEAALTEARRLVSHVPAVELEALRRFEPTYTDPRHELMERLCANAQAVMGRRPVVNMRVGASDARLYRGAGVPTAVYGPTPYNMGGPDEHVSVEELQTLSRVYALTAFDFLTA